MKKQYSSQQNVETILLLLISKIVRNIWYFYKLHFYKEETYETSRKSTISDCINNYYRC